LRYLLAFDRRKAVSFLFSPTVFPFWIMDFPASLFTCFLCLSHTSVLFGNSTFSLASCCMSRYCIICDCCVVPSSFVLLPNIVYLLQHPPHLWQQFCLLPEWMVLILFSLWCCLCFWQ
jgi:hypothetical protein